MEVPAGNGDGPVPPGSENIDVVLLEPPPFLVGSGTTTSGRDLDIPVTA